jgi:hypothetical protein
MQCYQISQYFICSDVLAISGSTLETKEACETGGLKIKLCC